MGYADVGPGGAEGGGPGGSGAVESVTINIRKLLAGEARRDD